MTTFAINFTDLTGNFWDMNWEPASSKNKNLTDTDVQTVIHFIRTGTWLKSASPAAKNCYDTLAAQIANIIIEDAAAIGFQRVYAIISRIERAYVEYKLSKKGDTLYERCAEVCKNAPTEDNTHRVKKLLKKIIKTENLFAVKLAEDEVWLTDVLEDGMKCCICGDSITDEMGHNPYPVRNQSYYGEKVNRCCTKCNYKIVIPARLRFGRNISKHRNTLKKLNYEELVSFVA